MLEMLISCYWSTIDVDKDICTYRCTLRADSAVLLGPSVSVIFVLIYFLVLVLVFQLFFSFCFVLVFIIFFVLILVLVLPIIF